MPHQFEDQPSTSGRRSAESLVTLEESGGAEGAQTLVKGLAILRAFHAGKRYFGNSDIAAQTGLTRPRVSQLAETLVQQGYLPSKSLLGKYKFGTALLDLPYPMLARSTPAEAEQFVCSEIARWKKVAQEAGMKPG